MPVKEPSGSPEWMVHEPEASSFLECLSDEIQQFVEFARLKPEEVKARDAIFDRVKNQIVERFKYAIVYEYGSLPSGLSLYFSDIDVAVENVRLQEVQPLLETHAYVKYINAHVPILKCRDYETGIEFDVSEGGIAVVRDVENNKAANEQETCLLLLLKHFLTQRNLNKPFTGGLSGHILSLLIRSFISAREEVFGVISNERTELAQLFLQFLDFYGCRFNNTNLAIVNLEFVKRRIFCSNTLCLISNQSDIGAAVFNWVLIRRSFEAALLIILRCNTPFEHEISMDSQLKEDGSILSRILSVNEAGMRIRALCFRCVELKSRAENIDAGSVAVIKE